MEGASPRTAGLYKHSAILVEHMLVIGVPADIYFACCVSQYPQIAQQRVKTVPNYLRLTHAQRSERRA